MMFSRIVVPGRFQPPHLGHMSLINQALKVSNEVIVVVGSAQESYTIDNPLTAGERIEALFIMLEAEMSKRYRERIIIVPVPDIAMNKVWVRYLAMLLPKFDAVMSGNELVLMLFEDSGYKALRPKFYRRDECSGTIIRRKVIEGGDWRSCVHPSVAEYLDSIGFEERIRRLVGSSPR